MCRACRPQPRVQPTQASQQLLACCHSHTPQKWTTDSQTQRTKRSGRPKVSKSNLKLEIALVDWAGHLEQAICRERMCSQT
jgi:hypothetical protein